MLVKPFYYQETNGIRITVRPRYLTDQSQPRRGTYVFAYFVRIENIGRHTVQLMSRRWLISDSIGEQHEVAGDGVVGEQPVLAPGAVHEYHSFCILKSPNGSMAGSYHFASSETAAFDAAIPQFILTTDDPAWPSV